MTVLDIARETVVTHSPDDAAVDAIESMREKDIGSVIVVEDGRPTGIVTDRAIAFQVFGQEADPSAVRLGDIAADDVDPVEADTGLYDLLEHMSEEGARRVPIVEDGELVGIISISDVVILLGMELQLVANVLRTASPAYERSATEIYD